MMLLKGVISIHRGMKTRCLEAMPRCLPVTARHRGTISRHLGTTGRCLPTAARCLPTTSRHWETISQDWETISENVKTSEKGGNAGFDLKPPFPCLGNRFNRSKGVGFQFEEWRRYFVAQPNIPPLKTSARQRMSLGFFTSDKF